MAERELDLVLYGATGFTGRLVAEHLAAHAPEGLRWGLAGRNEAKLARLREALTAIDPQATDLPIVLADSTDPGSLAILAQKTRVLCTTVGPYLRYGLPVAEACAHAGTHYCDLTGEVPFMQRTIAELHDVAVGTGARIVHTCGYDSIPSDLGTWMVQQAMVERGAPARRVTTVVGPSRGGFSGGTVHSLLAVLELAEDRARRRAIADPYGLDPAGSPKGPKVRDQAQVLYRHDCGQWTAPFVMAPINTRVVRRSHALLGHPWGEDFLYTETMATGGGLSGRAKALGLTAGLGGLMALASRPGPRKLLERTVLPAPGDGPDAETRASGFFRHLVLATGDDPSHRLVGRVVGHRDPGYAGTAILLGQSALALAVDEDDLPDAAGCLTPSTAMGGVLLDRLREAGMDWTVEDWPEGTTPRP